MKILINNQLTSYALERKIGATMRSANEPYMTYGECEPELASRFGAKKKHQRQALLGLEASGA
jgi:hypothetical protein